MSELSGCFVYKKQNKYKVFLVGSTSEKIHLDEVTKIKENFEKNGWTLEFEYERSNNNPKPIYEILRNYFKSCGQIDISFVFYLIQDDFTSHRATSIRRYLQTLRNFIYNNDFVDESCIGYADIAKSCYFIIQQSYYYDFGLSKRDLLFQLPERTNNFDYMVNYIIDELAKNEYRNAHVFPVSEDTKAISASNFYNMQVKYDNEVEVLEPAITCDAKPQSVILRTIWSNVIKLSCLNLSFIIAGSLILALTSGMILQAVGIGLVVSGGIGLGVTFFRAFKEHNSLKNKTITPSEILIAHPVNIDYIQ